MSFGGATRCTQRSRGWYMRISKCNYACKLLCLLQFCAEEIHFPNHSLTSIWSWRNLLSLVEVWSGALCSKKQSSWVLSNQPLNGQFGVLNYHNTKHLTATHCKRYFFLFLTTTWYTLFLVVKGTNHLCHFDLFISCLCCNWFLLQNSTVEFRNMIWKGSKAHQLNEMCAWYIPE